MDPPDFLTAADHQRRLEKMLEVIQADYPDAALEFRERRIRPSQVAGHAAQTKIKTGRLNLYEDL